MHTLLQPKVDARGEGGSQEPQSLGQSEQHPHRHVRYHHPDLIGECLVAVQRQKKVFEKWNSLSPGGQRIALTRPRALPEPLQHPLRERRPRILRD